MCHYLPYHPAKGGSTSTHQKQGSRWRHPAYWRGTPWGTSQSLRPHDLDLPKNVPANKHPSHLLQFLASIHWLCIAIWQIWWLCLLLLLLILFILLWRIFCQSLTKYPPFSTIALHPLPQLVTLPAPPLPLLETGIIPEEVVEE